MKEIYLSEEQLSMLTEMLTTLFLEYSENAYTEQAGIVYYADKMGTKKYQESNACYVYIDRDGGCDRIHWLEFCIFYLQPALKFYMSTYTIKSLGSKYIDKLYSHFKTFQNANNS